MEYDFKHTKWPMRTQEHMEYMERGGGSTSFNGGDIVRLKGLNRTEWNGKKAEIVGKVVTRPDGTRRWPIRLTASNETASIKEINIEFVMAAFTVFPEEILNCIKANKTNFILDINTVIKAADEKLPTFSVDKCSMAMRSLPGLDNYYVVFQSEIPVLAIFAMTNDVKIEHLQIELKKDAMGLVFGWMKDGLDRYLQERGIAVPWLQ